MAEAPAPQRKSVAEEENAMTQKIGERELELRRQREAQFGGKPAKAPAVPELPKTSGRKPVRAYPVSTHRHKILRHAATRLS